MKYKCNSMNALDVKKKKNNHISWPCHQIFLSPAHFDNVCSMVMDGGLCEKQVSRAGTVVALFYELTI